MITAKERYDNFLKKELAAFLRNKDFKKKGNRFILHKEELAYVFYPLRGDFNNKDYVDFSLNFDIYTANFEDRVDLETYVIPLLSGKVANVIKDRTHYWITLKTEDADAEEKDQKMKEFFFDTLGNKVIPYFLKFKTIEDIIQLLETTPESEQFWDVPGNNSQKIVDIALYYWILGKKQKAIETLDKGILSISTLIKEPQFHKSAIAKLERTKSRILNGPDRYVRESLSALI